MMLHEQMLVEYIKTLTNKPISVENHLRMMKCAEQVASQSDQAEQVGAVLASQEFKKVTIGDKTYWMGTGQYTEKQGFNRAPTDDSHSHHAEIFISKLPLYLVKGATLYVTRRPCARCTEMLLPLGLRAIYYRDEQPEMGHLQALRDAGVHVDGGWIQALQPMSLECVQQTWANRWQEGM